MPARTSTAVTSPSNALENLPIGIAKIFDQVQNTTANHQKNFVALYKLQADAALHTERVQHGRSIKLTGERAFEDAFLSLLSRVLPVKRGAAVADRVMKFVGGYIKFMNEKAIEERRQQEISEEDDDTTASRFVSRVLKYLFKGCVAKDKVVRFRVVQCIAEMVSHLGEIDEDLYLLLRSTLLERIRDKESTVRVQVVIALCKLSTSEDSEEQPSITEVVMDALTFDTSADVRRAGLLNLPPTPRTLPALLARTRDVDPAIRKLVYSSVLEPNCVVHLLPDPPTTKNNTAAETAEMEVGMTHPRALTIAQRELVVRNGLGDREESVRNAAAKLLSTWVDVVQVGAAKPEEDAEDAEKDEGGEKGDLIAFLRMFDLTEGKVVEDALLSVFTTRVDILDALEFPDSFWESLTPEKSLLARVFADHCVATKDETRLEHALPVVTALAFRIQSAYNALFQDIQTAEEEELLRAGMEDAEEDERRAKMEEARMDREFVIGEMLRLGVDLDYADEIGRRKMFQLVRDMISQDVLPEGLVSRCLDVLRKLSPNERDLIRVVVEVVHELRDPSEEEEPTPEPGPGETPTTVRTVRALPKPSSEMSPEEKARMEAIDLRCLSLCIGMLERVNGTFEENSTLEGILGELIIPAVKSKELMLREKGLVSLGLCCLIARRMALNSFQLFLGQVQSAPEVLKIRVLQIVFDILMVHESDFLGPGSTNGERIVEFLLHILENEESENVQALLCMGIAKLALSGMIVDDRVIKALVLLYMSPETVQNQELRQCLSYFFPVYCYSSASNQRRMQKIFVPLFEQLSALYKEWEGEEEMITPAQAGLMFVDWTDPLKAVAVAKNLPGHTTDDAIHVDLASDVIKALYKEDMERDDKKALCQLLGKLSIPDTVDDDKLRTIKLLMHNLRSRRPLRDAAAKNAFAKFETAFSKKFEKQLEDFNEEEYRQLEYLKELFEFLDDIIPDEEEEEIELPKKRGGRKRRSESVTTDATSVSGLSGDDRSTPSTGGRKTGSKSKAKRRRLYDSNEESDETEKAPSPASSKAPTRVMPKRSAADKSRAAVKKTASEAREGNEDDNEDDDEEEEESTPAPARKSSSSDKRANAAKAKEAARLDAEIDKLLDSGEESQDSIMDSSVDGEEDEDDEEDEVAGIL